MRGAFGACPQKFYYNYLLHLQPSAESPDLKAGGAFARGLEVARIVRRYGARLHVDAVQAVGKLATAAWSVGDSIAVASHKIGGPKGIGALLWRGCAPLPLVLGGQQQRGLRAGTLDAVAAAGFQAALAHVSRSGPDRHARLGTLRDRLEDLPLLANRFLENSSWDALPRGI